MAKRARSGLQQPARRPRKAGRSGDSKKSPRSESVDKTLTKGLLLIERLAEHEQSCGISELADELRLNKSNVHRLLQTLIRCGYVSKEDKTERYQLSSKLWRISHHGILFDALRHLARPVLRGIASETGETAIFVIVEQDQLVLIDQVEAPRPIRAYFSVGQSFKIDQVLQGGRGLTALQSVALASRSKTEVRDAIESVKSQLRKGAPFVQQQLSRIEDVREQGFALSHGDWYSGVNAVAVPVSDESGHLQGILACFGPADRLTDQVLAQIRKLLWARAKEFSQRLRE